jgi:hypothetical protein
MLRGAMSERLATCSCGQVRLHCVGEPLRISVCHCPACQRRTGSVLAAQARYPDAALRLEGRTSEWIRHVEDGDEVIFQFCPTCAATVCWQLRSLPGFTSVAVGAFANPSFPPPTVSVWEATMHPWLGLPTGVEHID